MAGMSSSARFTEALNAQITREFGAAHQYLAVSVWCSAQTFPRLAAFFAAQADEERMHAMKMVGYLVDRGELPQLGAVGAPKIDFADHVEPVEVALEQERRVTGQITELAMIAREDGDLLAEQFMQWFLAEQVEEESSMGDLLAVAQRTRENPMLLEDYLAREWTPQAAE